MFYKTSQVVTEMILVLCASSTGFSLTIIFPCSRKGEKLSCNYEPFFGNFGWTLWLRSNRRSKVKSVEKIPELSLGIPNENRILLRVLLIIEAIIIMQDILKHGRLSAFWMVFPVAAGFMTTRVEVVVVGNNVTARDIACFFSASIKDVGLGS